MGRHKKIKHLMAYDSEAFVKKGENRELVYQLAYGAFAYKVGNKYHTKIIKSSDEFIEFLKKHPKTIVYMHNARYDLSLLSLSKYRDLIRWISFDKPINVSFNFNVRIRDSLNYLDGKLESLRKTFLREEDYVEIGVDPEYKDEAPYYLINEGKIKEWNKWVSQNGPKLAKNDALILLKIMENFHKLFGKIRTEVSLPSIAFNINKELLAKKADYNKVIYPLYYKPDPEVNGEEALESYRGGRTEALKITLSSTYLSFYDVNSLYPTVMKLFQYPYKFKDDKRVRDLIKAYQNGLIGLHLVRWKCSNEFMPIVVRVEKDNEESVTQVKEGEYWITSPELDLLESECEGEVEVKRSLWFYTYPIFTDFVDKYYALKQKAKKGSPEYYLYKKLLNSLYGKWGEHKERRRLIQNEELIQLLDRKFAEKDNKERLEIEDGLIVSKIDWGFYTVRQELKKRRNVAIASLVTAFARVYLYNIIKQVGHKNVYYCDTDSIAINVKPPATLNFTILGVKINQPFEGDELGSLKKEKEGYFQILGKKFYFKTQEEGELVPPGFKIDGQIAEGLKSEDITLKGVPLGSKLRIFLAQDPFKMKVEAEYNWINANWREVTFVRKVKEINPKMKLNYKLEDNYYQGYPL